MADQGKKSSFNFKAGAEIWLPVGLFSIVMLLVMPVPPWILDSALALSIGSSLLILLVILYIRDPADFSGFPTLLLMTTMFRLALNVASTRLILLDNYAGNIIEAFGSFVVRGNYIVGLVVFIILVLVNFVVITKGSGRIAEVAARFTLDAMPGKQMAIDAELNAGVIDESEARRRRRKVEEESDFYGAMDGASKFVRGDAIAGILITLVNIIGGFGIGMFQKGMPMLDALQRFSLLSIGDGLVSQLPSLITSTATGILVTRATAKDDLGKELSGQLLFSKKALWILCGMLGVFAIVPGFPFLPFFGLGVAVYLIARASDNNSQFPASNLAADQTTKAPAAANAASQPAPTSPVEDALKLDTLQVELGYGLIHMADKRKGGDLLGRITGIRTNFARELGIVIPPVKVKDNVQLSANHYRILLNGDEIAEGEIQPGQWLAMNATDSQETLKGIPAVEPVYNLPATWVTEQDKRVAENKGFTVVDSTTVLVTHLSETIKRCAPSILNRQAVHELLERIKETHSAVVNELVPNLLSIGQLHRVLQNLLAEGLSIRNLSGILEKISDLAPHSKNPDELSEHARTAIPGNVLVPSAGPNSTLNVMTLAPELEAKFLEGLRSTHNQVTLTVDPAIANQTLTAISRITQQMMANGLRPLLVCGSEIRLPLYRYLKNSLPDIAVCAYSELPPNIRLKSYESVTLSPNAPASEPVSP